MSEEKSRKIPLPAVAIVCIVLAALAAERFLVESSDEPEQTEQAAESAPAEEAVEEAADPVEEKPPVTLADLPNNPPVSPETATWSTYHGGPALGGYTTVEIPEEPALLWRVQADHGVYHTPVADANGIYFHTLKGHVIAVDFEGGIRWQREFQRPAWNGDGLVPEHFDSPIACFGDRVYVGSIGGRIYAIDSETGEDVWVHDADAPLLGTVNLTEKGELVFVTQDVGALHAISTETGDLLWEGESIDQCDGSPSASGPYIVYGSCAAALHVFSAVDGSLIRNVTFDEESQVAGGVVIAGDALISGSYIGRIYHVNAKTGDIVWTNDSSMTEVFTTPAVNDAWVIVGSDDGNIYGIDRVTGETRWAFESIGMPTSPVIAGNRVIVGADGLLSILDLETGEELWSYEVSDEIAAPAIINGMIVVGSSDGSVAAFGAPRGE